MIVIVVSLAVKKLLSDETSVVLSATIVSSPEPGKLVNVAALINCAVVIVIPEAVVISRPVGTVACVISR